MMLSFQENEFPAGTGRRRKQRGEEVSAQGFKFVAGDVSVAHIATIARFGNESPNILLFRG
jgi:hypothetical protein